MQPHKLYIKKTELSDKLNLLQDVQKYNDGKHRQVSQTYESRAIKLQKHILESYGGWKSWVHPSGKVHVLTGRELEHTDAVERIGYKLNGQDPFDVREQALNDGWMRVNYYKTPRGMELSIEYRRGPIGDSKIVPVIRNLVERRGAQPTSILWEDGKGGHKFFNNLNDIRTQGQYKSRVAAFR